MLCTVSCRAQPIHSFKLIIHLDDTVQRLISKCPANSHTYASLFLVGLWYKYFYASVKSVFFYYLKVK